MMRLWTLAVARLDVDIFWGAKTNRRFGDVPLKRRSNSTILAWVKIPKDYLT